MLFDTVKVFSATRSRGRNELGEKISQFLNEFDGTVVERIVCQSSDREFHCLTIILFLKRGELKRRRARHA